MLRYLAMQLAVPAEVYRDYSRRPPTRIEHARELALRLGLRASGRADMPMMVDLAAEAAWSTDRGFDIASALMEGLRDRKIILPAPDTIERAGATGRARARRLTADALAAPLTAGSAGGSSTGLLLQRPGAETNAAGLAARLSGIAQRGQHQHHPGPARPRLADRP